MFFDSKEEVLSVEITILGKELLSIGKFQPEYYSFIDDDIIYDTSYIQVNEGTQNYNQKRILYETPKIKLRPDNLPISPQESGEYTPDSYFNNFKSENRKYKVGKKEKTFTTLGNSDPDKRYYPAWQIKAFKNNIYSCTTSSNAISEVNLHTASFFIQKVDDLSSIDKGAIYHSGTDNVYISSMEYMNSLFEIVEANTLDEKENFEIEIFKKEEDGSYKKLYFNKKPQLIKNNILLEEEEIDRPNDKIPSADDVEYYFDIFFDDEIHDDVVKNISTTSIYDSVSNKDNRSC